MQRKNNNQRFRRFRQQLLAETLLKETAILKDSRKAVADFVVAPGDLFLFFTTAIKKPSVSKSTLKTERLDTVQSQST